MASATLFYFFLISSYFVYHSGYNFLNDTGRNPSFFAQIFVVLAVIQSSPSPCSTVQKGLSLGIRKDDPAHPAVQIQEEGINFFIEGDDEWFFDGHNLSVTLNEGDDFPQFNYEK